MVTASVIFTVFFILSYFLGAWADVAYARFDGEPSLVSRVSFGGVIMLALGMAAGLAGGLMSAGITAVLAIAILLWAVVAAAAAVKKKRKGISSAGIRTILPGAGSGQSAGFVLAGIFVISVTFETYLVITRRADSFLVLRGIDTATAVFDSKQAVLSDPLMVFWGTLSGILNVHPLRMVFTLLPPTLVTFYNLCQLALINRIFTDRAKAATAFAAVTGLHLWGYQSEALICVTLLMSWAGIGVFSVCGAANVLVEMLTVYLPYRAKTRPPAGVDAEAVTEDDLEEWDMNYHKIINAKNLAIALGVLAVLLAGAVFVLNSKINRLYAATVNLQEDMNRRCSMYEFVPEGGGIEGYLLQGSDGLITFIGGGDSGNADELADFLARYGSVVDKWYVYGSSDKDCGAMKAVLSSGEVTAGNVYVITAEELKELQ